MEKRLIDADKARVVAQRIYSDPVLVHAILNTLNNTPTVDAVEVVRCKDCRDCEMCYPEKQLGREATQAWLCKRYKMYRKPDDFCSRGERKEESR